MSERMGAILQWCEARSILQVYAFFRGCDPHLEAHELRIRYVVRNGHELTVEADEPWVASMEDVVQAINAIKKVA